MSLGGYGLTAFFAALCAAALAASLVIELVRKPRKSLAFLALLRLAALGLLLWMLSTFWSDSWKEEALPGRIVLLRDASLSMSLLGAGTKAELAEMEENVRSSAKHATGVAFDEFVFASELRPPGKSSECGPGATALGDAILEVNRRLPGAQIALSSDACSNAGIPPMAAASIAAPYGTKMHVLLPESMEGSGGCDLRISGAEAPAPWSFSTGNFFRGVVERSGEAGGSLGCRVELLVDGAKAAEAALSVDAPLTPFEIELPKDAKPSPGWHEFELRISGPLREASSLNNSAPGIFKVPEADTVMLLWDRAGPELSALKPLVAGLRSKADFAYAAEFAAKDAEEQRVALSSWTLLVLGAVNPDVFKPAALDGIAAKVKGGTLSMVFLNPSCLGAWLSNPSVAPLLPLSSENGMLAPGPLRWLEYGEGRDKLRLPLRMAWNVSPSNESAVKACMLSGEGLAGRRPAILSDGRVSAVAFLGTWRWKLDQDRRVAAAFQPFWESFLESCDSPAGKGLSLSAEPKRAALSKGLYEFFLEDFSKRAGAGKAKLVLEGGGGALAKAFSKTGPRSYSCQLLVSKPGVNWFHAELEGLSTERSNRVPVLVEDEGAELKVFGGSAGKLKRLAEASGGSVISLEKSRKAADLLKTPPRKVYVRRRDSERFGREALLALMAAALLSAEWLARRLEARDG